MKISVNTNLASLTAQKSLSGATSRMNTAMERMILDFAFLSSVFHFLNASLGILSSFMISDFFLSLVTQNYESLLTNNAFVWIFQAFQNFPQLLIQFS